MINKPNFFNAIPETKNDISLAKRVDTVPEVGAQPI